MTPLAFMAQHVWEVAASVFALTVIVRAFALLIRGTTDPDAWWMSAKGARVAGGLMLLLGAGIAFAAFIVDAEERRKWPRRYVVKVTPPNGEWDTQRPMGRFMIKRRLFADKAHIQDVAPADAQLFYEGEGRALFI